MKLAPLVTLGLVNGVLAVLLFAAALVGLGVLSLDPRTAIAGTRLLPLLVSAVGPAMIVISLIAAVASSLARKSPASAQVMAMIVAACLGCALITQNRSGVGLPLATFSLAQIAFVVSLALPWAIGAGWFKAFRKPA